MRTTKRESLASLIRDIGEDAIVPGSFHIIGTNLFQYSRVASKPNTSILAIRCHHTDIIVREWRTKGPTERKRKETYFTGGWHSQLTVKHLRERSSMGVHFAMQGNEIHIAPRNPARNDYVPLTEGLTIKTYGELPRQKPPKYVKDVDDPAVIRARGVIRGYAEAYVETLPHNRAPDPWGELILKDAAQDLLWDVVSNRRVFPSAILAAIRHDSSLGIHHAWDRCFWTGGESPALGMLDGDKARVTNWIEAWLCRKLKVTLKKTRVKLNARFPGSEAELV